MQERDSASQEPEGSKQNTMDVLQSQEEVAKVFCTVTERDILEYLNKLQINQATKGIFENKAPLKPVVCNKVWGQIQIDLMSMTDLPCTDVDGKVYQWVLSCIDVFSRYLVLRPLHSKETSIVAMHLLQIFSDFGTPSVVQSDRGSEFLGAVEKIAKLLHVKIVHSSVRHPQSQGKVI